MPLLAVLHVLLVIVCGVHAIRTGQPLYWLVVLFMFPGLGTVVYVLAVWLPSSRAPRQAAKALQAVGRAMDPGRAVREARQRLADTPTAQHQMQLAEALLAAGELDEAATLYDRCLQGPFANDADLRWGAARVQLERGHGDAVLAHLDVIAAQRPDFRPEAVGLLRARALALLGRQDEAGAAFEHAVARFGSFEAKAERVIWAWQQRPGDAAAWQQELDDLQRRWTPATFELNAPLLARLRAAKPAR